MTTTTSEHPVLFWMTHALLGIALVCFCVRLVFYFHPMLLIEDYGLMIAHDWVGRWNTTLVLVALFFTFYTAIVLSFGCGLYRRIVWGKQPMQYWITMLLLVIAYTFMEKTHAAIMLDSLC